MKQFRRLIFAGSRQSFLYQNCSAIMKHHLWIETYSDRSKTVQKCIFELNVFICPLTCLLISFEVQVQPSFESDEKITDIKFLQIYNFNYKLEQTAHCAFKIYWSVDNSLQLDKNELSSTKIEFFFPLEFVWKSSWIFDGRQ